MAATREGTVAAGASASSESTGTAGRLRSWHFADIAEKEEVLGIGQFETAALHIFFGIRV